MGELVRGEFAWEWGRGFSREGERNKFGKDIVGGERGASRLSTYIVDNASTVAVGGCFPCLKTGRRERDVDKSSWRTKGFSNDLLGSDPRALIRRGGRRGKESLMKRILRLLEGKEGKDSSALRYFLREEAARAGEDWRVGERWEEAELSPLNTAAKKKNVR